jgi:trehalose synthase
MHEVNVGRKSLADYRSIVPKDLMAEIDELGEQLKGRQVLHVNATAFGGGVAEILYTLVPLVNDIGLEAHWQVLTAPPEFYNVTKSFHNGLQGHAVEFPPEARAIYEEVCRANAAELTRPYDFVVIHDPQPLAVRDFVSVSQDRSTWWIWRCHIDTSTPDQGLYDYLLPYINHYDAAVYTLRDYVPQGLTIPVREIAPTIDPLAPKNMQLPSEEATYIVRQFGIDV